MMSQADRDFTFRQLRTFICAARSGSFSHAAAELGISQPAVSDQIALLESRLGHALFVRRVGTTPQLTPEGAKLLETAGNLLDTSKAMRRDKGKYQQQRLRVCIGPRLLDHYLKPMLPEFYRDIPGLQIELMRVPRLEVQPALERGRIDLVVYTLGEMPAGWTNGRVVCEVMTVMAGPPGIRQRLESGKEAIEDLQFILPSTGKFSENWLERQLHRLKISLRKPVLYLEFTDVIQRMVEDGQGVTMLMYEQVADGIRAGRLEIFGPNLPAMQRVIARSDHAPDAARIIEQRLFKAMSGPPPGTRSM
jgi:DNA-binding transcriptional LysR family regulator